MHPSIAADVYAALQRGDFSTAVRDALAMVEIKVRDAGDFTDDDIGVDLMRKVFNSNAGPLTDYLLPEPERRASSICSPARSEPLRTRTHIAR